MNATIAEVDERMRTIGKTTKQVETTWAAYKRYRGFGALVRQSTLESSLAAYHAALEAYGEEQEALRELFRKLPTPTPELRAEERA